MGSILAGPGMKGSHVSGSAELELENIVPGVFTPVLAKHSKSFSLIHCDSAMSTECSAISSL